MTVDPHAAQWARAIWAAGEPYVLAMLFASEGRDAVTALGVPERATYFAVRSAPLGRTPSAVVAAAFHGFPIAMLDSILSPVWATVDPGAVITAHHASLPSTAHRVFDHTLDATQVQKVADRLTDLCANLDTAGRPLAAANQDLNPPAEVWARLWHACTTLREYRGDAHIAALVAADLTVPEALVLTAAWADGHIQTDMLRTSRQLTPEVWAAAAAALTERHLMTPDGTLTTTGHATRDHIENQTDQASHRPWAALTNGERQETLQLLTALSTQLITTGTIRPITPVGAPWPPPVINTR